MFGSLGITELVLILVIVLIIFGAGKIPQLGEGLGKAIKGFKKSVHDVDAVETDAQTFSASMQLSQLPVQTTTATGSTSHVGEQQTVSATPSANA